MRELNCHMRDSLLCHWRLFRCLILRQVFSVRKRIFEVIEVSTAGDKASHVGDKASHVYDWFMMVMILCSLVPLATKSTAPWTVAIDWVTVCIFIICSCR